MRVITTVYNATNRLTGRCVFNKGIQGLTFLPKHLHVVASILSTIEANDLGALPQFLIDKRGSRKLWAFSN